MFDLVGFNLRDGMKHECKYDHLCQAIRHRLTYNEFYQYFYTLQGLPASEVKHEIDRQIEVFIRRLGSNYKHQRPDYRGLYGPESGAMLLVGVCGDRRTSERDLGGRWIVSGTIQDL